MKTGPVKYVGMFKVYLPGEQSKTGLSHKVPIGSKFGKLTVIGVPFVATTWKSQSHLFVVCECECGTIVAIPANHITNGRQISCGCLRGRHPNTAQWKHGGRGTALYNIWSGMKQRCNCETHKNYDLYGGRGIKVCEQWLSDFAVFRDWATSSGYERGLCIDRINHNLGYQPDNCQWLTPQENGKKVWTDLNSESSTLHAEIAALKQQLAELNGARI